MVVNIKAIVKVTSIVILLDMREHATFDDFNNKRNSSYLHGRWVDCCIESASLSSVVGSANELYRGHLHKCNALVNVMFGFDPL